MRKAVVAVVAATALVAGCGGESGTAQPAAERWDPCSIPQDAIAATGLDPEYREIGWSDGIVVEDWTLCTFRAPKKQQSYFLSVMSSDVHTVSEARENEQNLNGRNLLLGDYEAYEYETNVSDAVVDCNVAVAVPAGIVLFTVDFAGGVKPLSDPCELALEHADELKQFLPIASKEGK